MTSMITFDQPVTREAEERFPRGALPRNESGSGFWSCGDADVSATRGQNWEHAADRIHLVRRRSAHVNLEAYPE